MAGQAAHDLFLDKAMPGHTRASAAADECAGTFSQEVASVQIKLNMCHLTNQSYDDEDEEPDKTRDADPTNDPWNKLLLQSAARPLKKRVHSHMEIEDLPKCPTMAIEGAPSVDLGLLLPWMCLQMPPRMQRLLLPLLPWCLVFL